MLVLVGIASLRLETGTDFNSYLSFWNAVTPLYDGIDYGYEYFEIGFRYFASFVKMFSENSVLYFFSLSFISLYVFYRGIQKYYVSVNLALFMYLCVFYLAYVFNGMGQAITMSIFVLSLSYFFEKKIIQIILITVVATLMHKSGLFILVAYFLYRIFNVIKIDYLYYIGIPVMFIVYKMNLLILIFSTLFPGMVKVYIEILSEPTSLFQMITRFIIVSVLFYFYKKSPNNLFYRNVFLVYLIGFLLYIGFSDFNMLATRINMFFRLTEILLFSNIIMYSKNLFTKNIIFLMIVAIYSYSYFTLVNHPDFYYQTFF
jgi:hypothetical protein